MMKAYASGGAGRRTPTSVQGRFYAAGNRSRLGNPSGIAVGRGRVATFQPRRGR